MPFGQVGVSGYTRRSSTGKVVNVSHYTQRRDLADILSGLGRVGSISAKSGTFPGGRQLPSSAKSSKVSRAGISAQKRQLAAMRKQVAALRKVAPADVAKNVTPARKLLASSFGSRKKIAKKREGEARKLESAQKLLKARGTEPDKLKEATNLLQSTLDKQKSREAASKKAAATKQATIDSMVDWIDANAAEIDANGVNVESALKSTGISREQLSNPDTPRTRAISQEDFDALWERGRQRIVEFQRDSATPKALDDNWETIKQDAYVAASEEWGGSTIDTHTGIALTGDEDLYALTVKDPGQESVTVPIGATPEEFDQAMDRARKQFDAQFQRQQHYLGVFNNVDTGLIEIDPVLVVDNLDDVETIGAFTHAVGGAYHFSDGLGYWPPYVGTPEEIDNEKQQKLREVAPEGQGGEPGNGGNQAGQAGGGNVTGGEGGAGEANPSQEKALTFSYGESTDEEFKALEDYTDIGNGFLQINAKLRGTLFKPRGFGHAVLADEDVDTAIANLTSLLEKSPLSQSTTLYRGFNPEHFEEDGPLEPGTIIEDLGFVSYTSQPSTAFGFTYGKGHSKVRAVVRTQAPEGFPAIDVDGRFGERGHGGMGENEFILPPGTKFRVVESRRPIGADEEFLSTEGTPAYLGETFRRDGSIMTVEPILPDRYLGGTNGNTAEGTGQALAQGEAGQATGLGTGGTPELGAGGRENNPAAVQEEVPISTEGWVKQPGSQGGSNPGGVYTTPDGSEYYVKESQTPSHAMNEVLAKKFYDLAGIDSAQLQLADVNGKIGTASPMIPGAKQDLSSKLRDPAYKAKLQEGFAVDAWLANWDVVGLVFDNVMTDANGDPVRVDPGGALTYRAMGGPKGAAFAPTVGELTSLRDESHENSFAAFGDISDEALRASAQRVADISPEMIDATVDSLPWGNPAEAELLKTRLKERRLDLMSQVGINAPASAGGISSADATTLATAPAPEDRVASAQKVWDGEFAGVTASVTTSWELNPETYVHHGVFHDVSGSEVGSFSRVMSTDSSGAPQVIHRSVYIDKSLQGQGIIAQFNAAAEEKYRQMGVKSIVLSTDEVGGYAWARAGYDWNFDPEVDSRELTALVVNEILSSISDAAYALYGEQNPSIYEVIQAQIRDLRERAMRFAANEAADVTWLPTPYELSQLGWQPGAEVWPGKNGMIGTNWEGIKYLD